MLNAKWVTVISLFGGKKSFVLFVVGCNIFYAGYFV